MGAFRFIKRRIAKVKQHLKDHINPEKQEEEVPQEDVGCKAAQHIRRKYLQKLGVGANTKPTGVSMISLTSGTGIGTEDERLSTVDGSFSYRNLELCNPEEQEQFCAGQEPDEGNRVQPCSADQDDFRVRYLSKLSYRKVWIPKVQRPPKSQAVLIFDWDDTLLCTSWLRSFTYTYINRESLPLPLDRVFAKMASEVEALLREACQYGQTFIVTNAEAGWVEASAGQWLPELLPKLQHIDIISARSRYQQRFPEIDQWKVQAFLQLQGQLDLEAITNVVSVGDAEYEMDAAHALGMQCTCATVKTIRFEANPSPQDLLKQLVLLRKKLPIVVESGHNVDLWMNRRQPLSPRTYQQCR